jgi:hypothetical protein
MSIFYDSLSEDNVQMLAIKLNQLKHKNIKILFVERSMPHHKIEVLYSYEYEKTIPMNAKGIRQIQHESDTKDIS